MAEDAMPADSGVARGSGLEILIFWWMERIIPARLGRGSDYAAEEAGLSRQLVVVSDRLVVESDFGAVFAYDPERTLIEPADGALDLTFAQQLKHQRRAVITILNKLDLVGRDVNRDIGVVAMGC